jgi:hypothetical protein
MRTTVCINDCFHQRSLDLHLGSPLVPEIETGIAVADE